MPGYERPTASLGGSARRAIAVAAALVIFLAVVSLKPWDTSVVTPVATSRAAPSAAALVERASDPAPTADAVATPAPTQSTPVTTDETLEPPWPAVARGDLTGGLGRGHGGGTR